MATDANTTGAATDACAHEHALLFTEPGERRDARREHRQIDVRWASAKAVLATESGSGGRIRTYDQAVNSRPLYH